MQRLAQVIVLATLVGATFRVVACADNEYESCWSAGPYKDCKCFPKAHGIPQVPNPVEVIDNLYRNGKKAVDDTWRAIGKINEDTKKQVSRSAEDIKAEITRAGKDTEEAVSAIGRYLERNAQDQGSAWTDALNRVREGKVVDAVWHQGIAPLQYAEKNAGKALLESSMLRTIGQVGATAYGGPKGAAAYAAWLTYRETGDIDLAVKVGIISGASNLAMSAAGTLPADAEFALAKRAIVVGAIGGASVAAAGGSTQDVQEAFLKAGAMVVIQDTFRRMDGHELSGKAADGEPYCVSTAIAEMTTPPSCAPPKEAYMKKPDGSLDTDSKGVPKIDMSKVDPKRAAVGMKSGGAGAFTEQSVEMKFLTQIPGMQGMAVFHDQWATKWDMGTFKTAVTIAPAVVLTYWGLGAPYYEDLRTTAQAAKRHDMALLNRSLRITSAFTAPARIDSRVTVRKDDVVQSYLCTDRKVARMIAVERPVVQGAFACRVVESSESGATIVWKSVSDSAACGKRAPMFAKRIEIHGFRCMVSAMNRF